jgi:hypothetical protein
MANKHSFTNTASGGGNLFFWNYFCHYMTSTTNKLLMTVLFLKPWFVNRSKNLATDWFYFSDSFLLFLVMTPETSIIILHYRHTTLTDTWNRFTFTLSQKVFSALVITKNSASDTNFKFLRSHASITDMTPYVLHILFTIHSTSVHFT